MSYLLKRRFPISIQHLLIPCFVIILSLLAFIFENQTIDLLVYQRSAITNGEYWRLFTGHFFHTNKYHLMLNLAGLTMLWALHGEFYTIKNYSLLFLVSALTCSLGLYFFSPDLHQYVGLSGVLHGIFVWGALMDIKQKDKTGYLLFIGVWLKIAHEQIYGASSDVSTLIAANVAVDAHLWGAIGGLIFSLLYFYRLQKTNMLNSPKYL
ncbi:MAG: rhombosortase [Gammaproteobacteria bacterium]|nr:MAG: rhombosortase [Gammaproteobacteria bacterium]